MLILLLFCSLIYKNGYFTQASYGALASLVTREYYEYHHYFHFVIICYHALYSDGHLLIIIHFHFCDNDPKTLEIRA